MEAAQAVAEILERTGETKTSLSRRSGVSRALIDDYLKGRRQPSVAQLERLGESVGLRMDIVWESAGELAPDRMPRTKPTPQWAVPSEGMKAPPLSVEERAVVIEMVCGTAMLLPARERGELNFPPFRTLVRS